MNKRLLFLAIMLVSPLYLWAQSSGWRCPFVSDDPCPSDCHRAEFVTTVVECATYSSPPALGCCQYVYAIYNCRKEPNCKGEPCGGQMKEPKIVIQGYAACTSAVNGCSRCGEVFNCSGSMSFQLIGGLITYFEYPVVCRESVVGGIHI